MSKSFLMIPVCVIVLGGAGCALPSPEQVAQEAAEKAVEQVTDRVQESVQKAAERGAEELIKQRTGTNVDLDVTQGGAHFEDPDTGKFFAVGERVAIPERFPADVPVYPNGAPTSISIDPGSSSASLLVMTKDTRGAIRDWFRTNAPSEGWGEEGAIETADHLVLTFTRSGDASAKLMVTIMPPNLQKETSILVMRKGD